IFSQLKTRDADVSVSAAVSGLMCAGATSAPSGLVNGRGGADRCRIEEFSPVGAAKRAQYAQDDTDTETCLCISCDATPAIDQDLLA
ncbi:hypothetical protein M9458_031291, partial [Cirrhinus mrigala]